MLITLQIDRYEILRPLGAGGMAEVFLARVRAEAGVERLVAIKRLLPQRLENPAAQEMFIDEARISALLRHSNIAQTLEFGKDQGDYFIVMEYVHGLSLQKIAVHRDTSEVPHAMAAFVVARLCEALEYAHTLCDAQGRPLNIVHRDLNPGNVLLTHHGEVKLIDFGIARAARRVHETQVGAIKGAIGYMSPEQVNQVAIDGRSDIFVAGTLLFEMLVGSNPFRGTNTADTLRRVCDGVLEPPAWSRLLHSDLARICERALQRKPAERYPSAGEMQEELDRYCHEQRYGSRQLAAWMSSTFPDLGAGLLELKSSPHFSIRDFPPGGTQAESDIVPAPPGHTVSDEHVDAETETGRQPRPRSPNDATVLVPGGSDDLAYAATVAAAAPDPGPDGTADTVSLRKASPRAPASDLLAAILEQPGEGAPAASPDSLVEHQPTVQRRLPPSAPDAAWKHDEDPGSLIEEQKTELRPDAPAADANGWDTGPEHASSPDDTATATVERAAPAPTPLPRPRRDRRRRRLWISVMAAAAFLGVGAFIVLVIGFGVESEAPVEPDLAPLSTLAPSSAALDLTVGSALAPDGARPTADSGAPAVADRATIPDAASPDPGLVEPAPRAVRRIRRRGDPDRNRRAVRAGRRRKPRRREPRPKARTIEAKSKGAKRQSLGDKGAEW